MSCQQFTPEFKDQAVDGVVLPGAGVGGEVDRGIVAGELAVSGPPQVERRPSNPEVSSRLSDVSALLGVLDDSPFTPNFSPFGGHSDLLDHLASRRCQNGPARSEISQSIPLR